MGNGDPKDQANWPKLTPEMIGLKSSPPPDKPHRVVPLHQRIRELFEDATLSDDERVVRLCCEGRAGSMLALLADPQYVPSAERHNVEKAIEYAQLFKADQKAGRTLDWGWFVLLENALKGAASNAVAPTAETVSARGLWRKGIEDAASYLGGSTFNVSDGAVVGACIALIETLKENKYWGPPESASSHVEPKPEAFQDWWNRRGDSISANTDKCGIAFSAWMAARESTRSSTAPTLPSAMELSGWYEEALRDFFKQPDLDLEAVYQKEDRPAHLYAIQQVAESAFSIGQVSARSAIEPSVAEMLVRGARHFVTGQMNLMCAPGESDRECLNRCKDEWLAKADAFLGTTERGAAS